MVSFPSGLMITPQLLQHHVSIDLDFEPSVGILARKFDKLGLNIRSFREPLKESVQQVVIPSIRRNFDAGGRPKWPKLTSDTIQRKGGDTRPLIRSGALRGVMGTLKPWTIDTEKAMISKLPANVWYGAIHQAGSGGASGQGPSAEIFYDRAVKKYINVGDIGAIPPRPFVQLMRSDLAKIDRVFTRWLDRRVKAAGL